MLAREPVIPARRAATKVLQELAGVGVTVNKPRVAREVVTDK